MKTVLYNIYIFCLVLTSSCISEYDLPGLGSEGGTLVVEGIITDGMTEIKLSRSVGLQDDTRDSELVNGAVISVECDDGNIYNGSQYENDGIYHIWIGTLDESKKYRLKIQDGKDTYESEFLVPVFTPQFDIEIGSLGEMQNNYVDVICAKEEGVTDFYMISYEEIWEIHPNLYAFWGFDETTGQLIPYNNNSNPKYNCWRYNNSRDNDGIILESTDHLQIGALSRTRIGEYPYYDKRFMEVYYINASMNMLRKSAYDYFANLQKNIEGGGSIFTPIPSEIRGNILCVSDPDVNIIGYIEVSTASHVEKYIENKDYPDMYTPPMESPNYCSRMKVPGTYSYEDEKIWEFGFYDKDELEGWLVAPKNCIDCRVMGGSKQKPADWPNDHI